MNILVCFKAVADLNMLSYGEFVIESDNKIDLRFVKTMLNCFDESALEIALKLSDFSESFNLSLNLTALTIADKRSDSFLKNIYALKYDKAVRIDCDKDIRFNPAVISKLIAEYIRTIGKQQVILMGRQCGEGDNAQTPLLLAERLRWPCITQVMGVELTEKENCIKVTSMLDGGVLTQIVETPVVLAIGNSPNTYMRVPTLKDKIKYSKKEIEYYNFSDFAVDEELIEQENDKVLIGLTPEVNDRKCEYITGNDSYEKAYNLYENYLKERLKR